MATRRLYDGAQIELGILPIVASAPAPAPSNKLWIKISGTWREAITWIKISGIWKQATPKTKVAGVWQ
jgi:hypothetical protein